MLHVNREVAHIAMSNNIIWVKIMWTCLLYAPYFSSESVSHGLVFVPTFQLRETVMLQLKVLI